MRILVSGGAGYIGSHAVRLFLERGHHVVVYDNLSAGHRQAVPSDRLVVGDLADVDRLDQLVVGERIEAVVHFAALASVPESLREPGKYYRVNLVHALNLLECLRRNGVRRFVFSSSCAVYGVPDRVPITEGAPPRPTHPYGATKWAVEQALTAYAMAYGWGCASLRYFNAAGAHVDGSLGEDHAPETHLIPLAIQAVLGRRAAVEVCGTDYPTPDGTCIRDYVHVDDLAEAHLLALEGLQGGTHRPFNLGIGRGYSVREVLQTVAEVCGADVPTRDAPRRPGDPPALVADAERARRELGWQPRYDTLRSIIETAWNWHRTHPNGFGN
jgi:UDP-glucose-4-epimerase GalE